MGDGRNGHALSTIDHSHQPFAISHDIEGDDMRRVFPGVVAIVSAVFLANAPAAAQERASIVGMVQDSSGAVLPGVTVEASSPALIERVRAGLTDGSGRYAIIDLRPGIYTVTFSLPGF